MGRINYEGMLVVDKNRAERAQELKKLISKPFDHNNTAHIIALKECTNNFECSTNQMYLYQSMGEGLKAWGICWVMGLILPIPNFASYFISTFLYLGAAGYILERFSITDFFEQLEEMKILYNWCLKNNETNYQPEIDNSENLLNQDIVRMIRLMAPLCSVDFMMAWPKELVKKNGEHNGMTHFLSSWASNTFSYFSKSRPSIDSSLIHELKVAVESRALDVGLVPGFERAINYFATNSNFRDILKEKLVQPIYDPKSLLSM